MAKRTLPCTGPDIDQDEDGWYIAACGCGWTSPPCPGVDEAAGFYGDHRAAAVARSLGGAG